MQVHKYSREEDKNNMIIIWLKAVRKVESKFLKTIGLQI